MAPTAMATHDAPLTFQGLLSAWEEGEDVDMGDLQGLKEVLQAMPKGAKPRLYSAMDTRVTLAFANGMESGEQGTNEDVEMPLTPAKKEEEKGPDWTALQQVAVVARILVEQGIHHAPPILVAAVVKLHDGALLAAAEQPNVQESVSRLCEAWWTAGLNEKEALVPQTIPYLLVKALTSGRAADVKRCYAMREALQLFDYEDATSIASLKRLLLRASFAPVFLRVQEGKRFISSTFHLQPQMVRELVAIIKNQIPCGRKSICEAYGEIIYRAWREAAGPCLVEIEHSVVQELMRAAVYAGTPTLAASLRRVLDGVHTQKKQRGVDAMLTRLYEPLLFRAFAVTNPAVRRNAVDLLAAAFPLQEPDSDNETNERLLQKQFKLLSDAMRDDAPAVRASASFAVANVLDIFWELIPAGTTSKLLAWMVDDLARDASSPAVRAAALQSIALLIQNPLAQPLLKAVLPRLKPALFDGSAKVRSAMADVLLAVRGIRAIHFYDIVPIEEILQALGTDGTEVAVKLTKLLSPSYLPASASQEEAASRVAALLLRSPSAGIAFCKYVLGEVVDDSRLWDLVEHLTAKLLLDASARRSDKIDTNGWEGIAAGIATLCETLYESYYDERKMKMIFGKGCLKLLLSSAPSSLGRVSILRIARHMPATAVRDLIKELDHTLVSMESTGTTELYRTSDYAKEVAETLSCICGSDKAEEFLDGLLAALGTTKKWAGSDVSGSKRATSAGNVTPEVAAGYLQLLLQNEGPRAFVMKMEALPKALEALRHVIVAALENPDMRQSKGLAQLFLTYGKAAMHLYLYKQNSLGIQDTSASAALVDVASWASKLLESGTPKKRAKALQEAPEQRRSKRIKRTNFSVASNQDEEVGEDGEDDSSGLTPAIDAALALLSEAATLNILQGDNLLLPSKFCASVLSHIAEQKRFCGQKSLGHSARFVAVSGTRLQKTDENPSSTEFKVRLSGIVEEVMKMATLDTKYIATIRPWLSSILGTILQISTTSWIEPVLSDLGTKWETAEALEDLGKALPHAILTAVGWPPAKASERSSKLMRTVASCAAESWDNKEETMIAGSIALLDMLQKRFLSMPAVVKEDLQALLNNMTAREGLESSDREENKELHMKVVTGIQSIVQGHDEAPGRTISAA
eukprot:scaffold431_cov334-Pavlova_lutheri.AAC.104